MYIFLFILIALVNFCFIHGLVPEMSRYTTLTSKQIHAPSRYTFKLMNLNEDIYDVLMNGQRGFMPLFKKNGALTFNKEELKDALKNAGASGLIAYGMLNCAYYTVVTAVVWFITSSKVAMETTVKTGFMMKLKENLIRFPKVMVLVWAGSQATKVFRLSGSLIMTPWTSSLLKKIESKLNIPQSKVITLCSSALLAFTAVFYALLLIFASIGNF